MMAGQDGTPGDAVAEVAPARIAEANRRIARYKAALDADGDPAEIGAWISEAKAQRLTAEAELRQASTRARLSRQQITDLITEVGEVAAALRTAEPGNIADAYKKLGLRLTYHPDRHVIRAAASPQQGNLGKWSVSEGGLEPPCPFGALAPQASASAYSATRTSTASGRRASRITIANQGGCGEGVSAKTARSGRCATSRDSLWSSPAGGATMAG
jgi:hypothetical protein